MSGFKEKWNQFWFAPLERNPLGILRIVLLTYILLYRLPEKALTVSWSLDMPEEFMAAGLALRYSLIPFPITQNNYDILLFITQCAGWAAVFGAVTRVSLTVFSLGYLYIAAVESAWGWHDHGPSMIVQILLVMIFAPGVDSLSFDRLWRWFLYKYKDISIPSFRQYQLVLDAPRWGLQLILCIVVLFYFSSGVSKLRYGGLRWFDGQTISFYLSGKSFSNQLQQYGGRKEVPQEQKWKDGFGIDYYIYGAKPNSLGKWIAASPVLSFMTAVAALLFELFAPLILFNRFFKNLILFTGASFHVIVLFTMGISFIPWCIVDLCLLDLRFGRIQSRLKIN